MLQNPDIVLVHYLNVPFTDDNKFISRAVCFADSRREWTREDLVSELKPMCKDCLWLHAAAAAPTTSFPFVSLFQFSPTLTPI